MKRFVGFILVLSFMFACLSACTGETVSLLDFIPAQTSTVKDYGGQQLIVTGGWNLFYTENEEDMDTIDSDRRLYRTEQVEKALNVDLVEDFNEQSEESGHYFQLYAAGNLKYHISLQYGTPNPVYDMYKSGMLEPLEYIPAIDLSDEAFYGTVDGRKAVTFEGLTYAHMGGVEDEGTDRGFLAYNGYLINSFGVEDPQELLEQGKWTFDTFAEMLPKVYDLSNPDEPIYGLSTYNDPQMLPFCAVFANGGQFVKQNENGTYVFALEDREAMEALQWVTDLHASNEIYLEKEWPPACFKRGQTTFYLGRSFAISKALDADSNVEEFYYIPFPYGPSGEYGVSSGSYASEAGGLVFFNCNDTEFAGEVYDYWLRFDDYPENLQLDKEEYALSNNFWSQESYDNFIKLQKVYEYDYFSQVGSALYNNFANALYRATISQKALSSVFDEYKSSIQSALDKSLNN